jgi:hypothetical protein
MFTPHHVTLSTKGNPIMAAKKKTTTSTPTKKSRKATKPAGDAVETPKAETTPVEPASAEPAAVEVPVPADAASSTDLMDAPPSPEATQQREAETPLAEVGPEEPQATAEPTTAPGATLRFWQVRRGPEIVGRTQAGTEEWALKQARKQFGEDVMVEPGRVAPGPRERATSAKKQAKDPSKLSALDAAAKVLGETGQPMTCQELIGAMAAKGYWSSPAGKTPAATLYSALLREASSKGDQARFVKAERGKFTLRHQP